MQVSQQQTVTAFTGSQSSDALNRGSITIFGRRHGCITSRDQSFTLAALAACSTENKAIHRKNLITRIAELERLAKSGGDATMLVTITCPSRMRRLKVVAGRSQANAEWNGTMPREASAYLSRVWFRARASLARNGVDIYGIYVEESGHDGTPHLHCLIYYTPLHGPLVRSAIRHFALDIDDINANAKHARVVFDHLDAPPSLISGYAAKYLLKPNACSEVSA